MKTNNEKVASSIGRKQTNDLPQSEDVDLLKKNKYGSIYRKEVPTKDELKMIERPMPRRPESSNK